MEQRWKRLPREPEGELKWTGSENGLWGYDVVVEVGYYRRTSDGKEFKHDERWAFCPDRARPPARRPQRPGSAPEDCRRQTRGRRFR